MLRLGCLREQHNAHTALTDERLNDEINYAKKEGEYQVTSVLRPRR